MERKYSVYPTIGAKLIKQLKETGFTLIEVMLAIVLGVIVLGLAVDFFYQGNIMYTKAQNRVDAQAQFRVAMNQLKRELGVATVVRIEATPSTKVDGEYYFSVKGNGYDNKDNTLVLEKGNSDGSGTPIPIHGCVALPGLQVSFSKSADNVINVHMSCADGAELTSDIVVQNTSSVTGTSGSAVTFETVN
jgi:prepilin-type N-terminal cleavage/methylation domain-containing protein